MKKLRYISGNHRERTVLMTALGLVINLIYGLGNGVMGFMSGSLWLITMSAYYLIISVMRFSVVSFERKNPSGSMENELFAELFSGCMFIVLGIVVSGTTVLAIKQNIGTKYHEIIMITIATYTFTKITFAIMNLCKCRKYNSPLLTTIRNISLADAAVSIFSMQRSMLVSFGEIEQSSARILNILTGTAVSIIVIILGINLIRKGKKNGEVKISRG